MRDPSLDEVVQEYDPRQRAMIIQDLDKIL